MVADPSPEQLRRLSAEMDDFTFLFTRVNPAGRVVRDARFYRDAGSLDVALCLFAADYSGYAVGLCAVLRGQVRTIDSFELADEPRLGDPWAVPTLARYEADSTPRSRFTVFASWDTGDGPRRYSVCAEAVNAEHAELAARSDKTIGTFLVAGVVAGWVPVEDTDAVWATVNGEQPVQAPEVRPWWARLVGR